MKFVERWKSFDDKLRDRAIEELLRFMTLFSTSAALICFFGTLMQQGDMRLPLILLTFMAIISVAWFTKKRKNEEKWGIAKRTGAEIFRIGKTQPTEAERKGIREEKPKKEKNSKADKRRERTKKETKAKSHTVKSGESLDRIAHKYGVSVNDLKKANNIKKNDNTIHPGDKIKIPSKKSKSSSKKKSKSKKSSKKKR